jgi:hypothetical protein
LGRNTEAIGWMGKAIALKPDYGNYYYIRSQIYNIVGSRSLALADALKANSLGTEISSDYIKSLQ